jgi:hypothetical protein
MSLIITMALLVWTITGFFAFLNYFNQKSPALESLKHRRTEATLQEYTSIFHMLFVGGPLVWLILAYVLLRKSF